jgi:hypothetical protein
MSFMTVVLSNDGVRPAQNVRVLWAVLDSDGIEQMGDELLNIPAFPKGERSMRFKDTADVWLGDQTQISNAPIGQDMTLTVLWQSPTLPWRTLTRRLLVTSAQRIEGSKAR